MTNDPSPCHEAFNRDEAFCDWIDGEEQALQCHRAEQRWSSRCDETRGRNLLAVEAQLHFCHRPDLALSSSDHYRLLTLGDNAQTVGEIPRNHEQSSAAVNE